MKYIKTNINQKISHDQYLNLTSNQTVMLNCTKCYLIVFRIHSIKCWINAYQDNLIWMLCFHWWMLLVGKVNKWKFENYILRRAKVVHQQNASIDREAPPYSSTQKNAHPYIALVSENLLCLCFYVSERAPFFSVLSAGGDVLIRANLQWLERVEWPQWTHFLIECTHSAGLNTPLINCPIKLIWALNHVYSSPCAFCKPLSRQGHKASAGIDSGKNLCSFYYDKGCA